MWYVEIYILNDCAENEPGKWFEHIQFKEN